MEPLLRFRSNGTFTIAQFTDLHWVNSDEEDERTRSLMAHIIQTERPDLVIFTGDIVDSYRCIDPVQSFRDAVSVVDESGIPWAITFGNHDAETSVTKSELMEIVSQCRTSVHKRGSARTAERVDDVLEVIGSNGELAFIIYLFDSGMLSRFREIEGYDWIHIDQIAWYVQQSRQYTARNSGKALPSMAFLHIPLPEYEMIWNREGCYGEKLESVCCPRVNSGLLATMVEMGDIMGVFAGHDHLNDYCGTLYGIHLCYGRVTGYNGYGRSDFRRGSRIIRVMEGLRGFQTWIRLDDGSVTQVHSVGMP